MVFEVNMSKETYLLNNHSGKVVLLYILPCSTMLVRYMLSSWVHLSVYLSITCRCLKATKHRITQAVPQDSPGTSFFMPMVLMKFKWGHLR